MTPTPRSYLNDTIVAIATPEGVGGIAIVRLSGPDALRILRDLFPSLKSIEPPESHKAFHGSVVDGTGDPLDEVLMLPMIGPHSYTGEDVIEFHCHGGRYPARSVMAACREAGARPAEAGEFTRRAFLNGRLSLDQAEAVADLIHAETGLTARAALGQLLGGLRREITEIETPLRDLLARLEGGLEFSDDDIADLDTGITAGILQDALVSLDRLLDLASAGRILREGVSVVLVGAPNSGKSSLFNALLGEDRAIVDHQAGTTRDVVSERVILENHIFVMHDTAGVREEPDRVEAIGIELTLALVAGADIVLDLVDESDNADFPEIEIPISARRFRLGTKADLHRGTDIDVDLRTSAKDGSGLDDLKALLLDVAKDKHLEEAISLGVVLNHRHLYRLETTRSDLQALLALVERGNAGDDVIATMLSATLAALGEISGREFTETMLGDVFSRFCVGK